MAGLAGITLAIEGLAKLYGNSTEEINEDLEECKLYLAGRT
jgi:hypothetical protein